MLHFMHIARNERKCVIKHCTTYLPVFDNLSCICGRFLLLNQANWNERANPVLLGPSLLGLEKMLASYNPGAFSTGIIFFIKFQIIQTREHGSTHRILPHICQLQGPPGVVTANRSDEMRFGIRY